MGTFWALLSSLANRSTMLWACTKPQKDDKITKLEFCPSVRSYFCPKSARLFTKMSLSEELGTLGVGVGGWRSIWLGQNLCYQKKTLWLLPFSVFIVQWALQYTTVKIVTCAVTCVTDGHLWPKRCHRYLDVTPFLSHPSTCDTSLVTGGHLWHRSLYMWQFYIMK